MTALRSIGATKTVRSGICLIVGFGFDDDTADTAIQETGADQLLCDDFRCIKKSISLPE